MKLFLCSFVFSSFFYQRNIFYWNGWINPKWFTRKPVPKHILEFGEKPYFLYFVIKSRLTGHKVKR